MSSLIRMFKFMHILHMYISTITIKNINKKHPTLKKNEHTNFLEQNDEQEL